MSEDLLSSDRIPCPLFFCRHQIVFGKAAQHWRYSPIPSEPGRGLICFPCLLSVADSREGRYNSLSYRIFGSRIRALRPGLGAAHPDESLQANAAQRSAKR